MKIEQNNNNESMKYDEFKAHQSIISGLVKDDIVTLLVNEVEVFRCKVLYGIKSHVNVVLQDKGTKSIELTEEQKAEAIAQYKENM